MTCYEKKTECCPRQPSTSKILRFQGARIENRNLRPLDSNERRSSLFLTTTHACLKCRPPSKMLINASGGQLDVTYNLLLLDPPRLAISPMHCGPLSSS